MTDDRLSEVASTDDRPVDEDGPVIGDRAALSVTRTLRIPLSELQWRFTPSGGPGGQHANRSSTAADLRFDVAGSPSLGPRQRARLLAALGPVVRVVASDARSQARNRQLALDRLADRLAGALTVRRQRRPTAPSGAARRQRVEEKRAQGARKRDRARGRQWDEGD